MRRKATIVLLSALLLAWAANVPAASVDPNYIPFWYKTPYAAGAIKTFKFVLYTAPTGGTKLWDETKTGLRVGDGGMVAHSLGSVKKFPTPLDFSQQMWVEVFAGAVRLKPRARLWVAPYALWSRQASSASGQLLVTGIAGQTSNLQEWRTSGGTPVASVDAGGALHAASVSSSGAVSASSFSGDGSGLTNLNAAHIAPSPTGGAILATNPAATAAGWISPNSTFWKIGGATASGGNSATGNTVNRLGAGDQVPLEITVGGNRALRLEYVVTAPDTTNTNLIGGSLDNKIEPGSWASVIGCGDTNYVNGSYASILGGYQNSATQNRATIGGGTRNQATNFNATVAGGVDNLASGEEGAVPGGSHNIAAGLASLAAGTFAKAWTDGSFVWADNSTIAAFPPENPATPGFPYTEVQPNQVWVRATGGIYFVTGADVSGNAVGVKLDQNATAWTAFNAGHAMNLPTTPASGEGTPALAALQATVESQNAELKAQREEIAALHTLISALQVQHAQLRSLLGPSSAGGPHAALEKP